MFSKSWTYILSSALLWSVILVSSAFILRDTPYFGRMLPILVGGALWSVVLAPVLVPRCGRP